MRCFFCLAIVAAICGTVITSCNTDDVMFTVSFNSNEGSAVLPQTVKEGEKAIKPDDPERNGHIFAAWYKEAGLINEWEFNTDVVIADMTLYAKWINGYTVSFDSNGGSAVLPQTVKEWQRIIRPEDPTRSGYLFASWYSEPELRYQWDFYANMVDADMTLYAKWNMIDPLFKISGLTLDNYPRVDGSTSAAPLNVLFACKLLDIGYDWAISPVSNMRELEPNLTNNAEKFWEKIKSSQTHESFINLIDNKTDLILSAREMSSDEKAYADASGVSLIETPIALDALIFIVHPSNPVQSLTVKQIQAIYTGEITNWKEVGGADAKINPYIRNANSGSQELMESVVMKGLDMADFPVSYPELYINSMIGVFDMVIRDPNAIGYTIHYYKEQIIFGIPVKTISVDDIYPNKESIGNGTFPFVADVLAVIRSDLDQSSMASKLHELLQTEAGKKVIAESGYVPN